jgi:hypothetical protein
MKPNIIAVDFDGTLCENKWPEIGMPNEELIEYLKKRQANGEKLILWTNRVGNRLDEAVKWSAEKGLVFDAVNENLPEIVEAFGVDSRKIFANEYIDDRNRSIGSCREKSSIERWAENEVAIACRREKPDRKDGEWDYGCACYESALKAFHSLCEDGHSGFSIGLTKAILNRLINNKPLLPIEDTDEVWSDISDMSGLKGEECNYQCKRMSSLFKYVYADGTVKYRDVDRYHGVNINCPDASYHSGLIDTVMDELYPITMPYMPADRAFKIYTEDFLVDPAKGDYDTVGILYVITPSMDKVAINRYFKEVPNGFAEIDESEYVKRKMKVQWDDLLFSDFKGIKEAFGFELHDWQKKYLKGELDSFPNGRGNGKTFAMNLKALLGDGDTVTFDELKRRYRMSNQERIYVNNILDMNAKLCAAGFTTNIIKRR